MPTPFEQLLRDRGITPERLSSIASVDAERSSQLLAGADPNIDEVRAVAKALRVSARALIAAPQDLADVDGKLRKNFRRVGFENAFETFDLFQHARELSSILPVRIRSHLGVVVNEPEKSLLTAEELASFVRAQILGFSSEEPIDDLGLRLLPRIGAYILPVSSRHVEGCAVTTGAHDFIFVAQRGNARMRFTLAHELCHYLVDLRGEGGWFDEEPMYESRADRVAESFANTFAAALLMPASAIGSALYHFRSVHNVRGDRVSDIEIVFLARFFGVNFQVAGRRCEDLDLIERGGSQSLYESVLERYKSPEKLADDLKLPPRETDNWKGLIDFTVDAARSKIVSGDASIGRLSELLFSDPIAIASALSNADLH